MDDYNAFSPANIKVNANQGILNLARGSEKNSRQKTSSSLGSAKDMQIKKGLVSMA
jgi:hypothetical protein